MKKNMLAQHISGLVTKYKLLYASNQARAGARVFLVSDVLTTVVKASLYPTWSTISFCSKSIKLHYSYKQTLARLSFFPPDPISRLISTSRQSCRLIKNIYLVR